MMGSNTLTVIVDEDSELLCQLFEVLERHNVDEGLRDTIMDIIYRWEIEKAPETIPDS
jgi:hypothetical protein